MKGWEFEPGKVEILKKKCLSLRDEMRANGWLNEGVLSLVFKCLGQP